jgi:hypothetical protein
MQDCPATVPGSVQREAGFSRFLERSSPTSIWRISWRLLPADLDRTSLIASCRRCWFSRLARSISPNSGGRPPRRASASRSRSAPGHEQESLQSRGETLSCPARGQAEWQEHRQSTSPNSRRRGRGLNPPPSPMRCAQSLCTSTEQSYERRSMPQSPLMVCASLRCSSGHICASTANWLVYARPISANIMLQVCKNC